MKIIRDVSGGDPTKVAYIVTDNAVNMRAARRMLVQHEGFK